MSKKPTKQERESVISIMFVVEIVFFIASGYALAKPNYLAFISVLLIGFIMAWVTGKEIEYNAVENFKEAKE